MAYILLTPLTTRLNKFRMIGQRLSRRGDVSSPSRLSLWLRSETFSRCRSSLSAVCVLSLTWLVSSLGSAEEQPSGLEDGYVLIAPMGASVVHLIDSQQHIVHSWDCGEGPGNATYLEKGGTLLRTGKIDSRAFSSRATFSSGKFSKMPGGAGGRIRRYSWDGELLWDYLVADDHLHHHHDVEPMPNGNVLVIAWERHTKDEAIAAGRDPETLAEDAIWTETILEIKPKGKTDGEVVWRWRLWDHLVQDHDETKLNHGKVADHPERVDFNYATRRGGADWIHLNSVDYNADLDQIALGARWFSEGWIIDHSTTTEEAAGSTGGRQGKGGDILYRWGNPAAYGAGTEADRVFFAHHDVRWIDDGSPGAGNLMIFNNGEHGARAYSSVDEFIPPVDEHGSYPLEEGQAFAPEAFSWSYSAPDDGFYSARISGAQRLPGGNTLVCSGEQGWLFVVTPQGERVWELKIAEWINPKPVASTAATEPSETPAAAQAQGKGKGKSGGKGKSAKGRRKGGGKGGKGGGAAGSSAGRIRGSAFRAPWYPADYSEAFEQLPADRN